MKTPTAATTPKPVASSSPGRPEKLSAPGLARLLPGKSAGRSRARPAASPMFVSRNKSVGRSSSSSALPDGGDPSSPKVTCIGQVRIRNRKKNKSDSIKTSRSGPYRFHCLCRLFLCKTKNFYSPYRFFFCWRKKKKKKKEKKVTQAAKAEAAAPPIAFVTESKIESDLEDQEAEDVETRAFVSSSFSVDVPATMHSLVDAPLPPKDAFLLMRCRSAPHNRSSALALSQFTVSPVPASETKEKEEQDQIEGTKDEMIEERGRQTCNDEEEDSQCSSTSQVPAGLTRCKSEPARKAERLMELSYCKWNGSGKGGMGMVQEVGLHSFTSNTPTSSHPPPLEHYTSYS